MHTYYGRSAVSMMTSNQQFFTTSICTVILLAANIGSGVKIPLIDIANALFLISSMLSFTLYMLSNAYFEVCNNYFPPVANKYGHGLALSVAFTAFLGLFVECHILFTNQYILGCIYATVFCILYLYLDFVNSKPICPLPILKPWGRRFDSSESEYEYISEIDSDEESDDDSEDDSEDDEEESESEPDSDLEAGSDNADQNNGDYNDYTGSWFKLPVEYKNNHPLMTDCLYSAETQNSNGFMFPVFDYNPRKPTESTLSSSSEDSSEESSEESNEDAQPGSFY